MYRLVLVVVVVVVSTSAATTSPAAATAFAAVAAAGTAITARECFVFGADFDFSGGRRVPMFFVGHLRAHVFEVSLLSNLPLVLSLLSKGVRSSD